MVESMFVEISSDSWVHVYYDFLDINSYLILVHIFISIEIISKMALHVVSKRLNYVVAGHSYLLSKHILHHAQNCVGLNKLEDPVLEFV